MKKHITIFLALIFWINSFSQDSFERNYGCYREFNQIEKTFGNTIQGDNVKFLFSVGKNNDMVSIINNIKTTFIREGEPFYGETKSGNKFQIIKTKSKGILYMFQYFDNEKLRIIFKNNMFEYDCIQTKNNILEENTNIYLIKSKRAYFHDEANFTLKRKAYLVYGQYIIAQKEYNGFIYTKYHNKNNQITKGWISKNDLILKSTNN